MTDITRQERIAIMIHDGHCTEQQAVDYCDKHPEIYGIIGQELRQERLI